MNNSASKEIQVETKSTTNLHTLLDRRTITLMDIHELRQQHYAMITEFSRGHHKEAAKLGEDIIASGKLDDDPLWLGRVHRDMSTAFNRLDMPATAQAHITKAYDLHSHAMTGPLSAPELRAALRERSATASYIGIYALRDWIGSNRDEAAATQALTMTRQAETDMSLAQQLTDRVPLAPALDQYEINMIPRWSMAESLLGDKHRGLVLGSRALWLATQSETGGGEQQMNAKDVLRARTRAVARGMAALAVNASSRVSSHAAQKIALKTL